MDKVNDTGRAGKRVLMAPCQAHCLACSKPRCRATLSPARPPRAARDRDLADAQREARALQREKAAWAKEQKALTAAAERHRRAAEEAREAAAAREAALKEREREEAKAGSSRWGACRPPGAPAVGAGLWCGAALLARVLSSPRPPWPRVALHAPAPPTEH